LALLASPLLAAGDGGEDDPDPDPDDDQVGDHLACDHQPRRLGLGGDVAEPNRVGLEYWIGYSDLRF
jgi:hypothetical protein